MYVSIMERKGIEKGRIEGIQLGRTETAQNLLRMGLDMPRIAEATGLSLEEIVGLTQAQNNISEA